VLSADERRVVMANGGRFLDRTFASSIGARPVENAGIVRANACLRRVRCASQLCRPCRVLDRVIRRRLAEKADAACADKKLASTRKQYLTQAGKVDQKMAVMRVRLAKSEQLRTALEFDNRALRHATKTKKRPRCDADAGPTKRFMSEFHAHIDKLEPLAKHLLEPQCLWGRCCTV